MCQRSSNTWENTIYFWKLKNAPSTSPQCSFLVIRIHQCTAPDLSRPQQTLRRQIWYNHLQGRSSAISAAGEPTPTPSMCLLLQKIFPGREKLRPRTAHQWRHLLEDAQHPFTDLTDQKNLEYLRDAKRLNPWQAKWTLFFTRFNFSISFRPGAKNAKADALSHLHAPEDKSEETKTILPCYLIVSPT